MKPFRLAMAFLSLATAGTLAQSAVPLPVVAIRAARLIDGRGGAPQRGRVAGS